MKIFIKSYSYLLFFTLLSGLSLAPFGAFARQDTQAFDSSIIVLAPTSMTNALNQIMRDFSTTENISASGTFESSSEVSRLILDGEAANIYITDDTTQMRDLQRLGALNVFSVANIASDTLVLVIPKDNFLKKRLEKFPTVQEKLSFVAKNVSLVIPDPEAEAAGKSIKQAFEKLGIWNNVSQKMLKAANTRNGLYLIANGNSAGIVYYSDAISDSSVEILAEIPQEYYDKIIYQGTIVAELDSDANKDDAEKFMNYLKSDAAKNIFTKFGFKNI